MFFGRQDPPPPPGAPPRWPLGSMRSKPGSVCVTVFRWWRARIGGTPFPYSLGAGKWYIYVEIIDQNTPQTTTNIWNVTNTTHFEHSCGNYLSQKKFPQQTHGFWTLKKCHLNKVEKENLLWNQTNLPELWDLNCAFSRVFRFPSSGQEFQNPNKFLAYCQSLCRILGKSSQDP